jgi:formamidopyrimidine-DNA glycosylase
MPELPDVEIYKRYMDSKSLKHKIKSTEIKETKVLEGVSKKKLQDLIKDKSFQKTKRIGKNLLAMLDNNLWLRLHFGMTGYLEYYKETNEENSHRRIIFNFENGYHLAYVNTRLLGKVSIVKNPDDFAKNNDLGIDAMDIKFEEFKKRIQERKGAIKSTLMNQEVIAGIGNIYADEILYQSNIHPKTTANKINEDKLKTMFNKMKDVINTAIEKEADPNKMPRSYLLTHRKENEKCPKCKGNVKKIKVSGRNGYYCPSCQKG